MEHIEGKSYTIPIEEWMEQVTTIEVVPMT